MSTTLVLVGVGTPHLMPASRLIYATGMRAALSGTVLEDERTGNSEYSEREKKEINLGASAEVVLGLWLPLASDGSRGREQSSGRK